MAAMKPEECDLLMYQAVRNKDLEAAVALYEKDAVFILDDGQRAVGHEAIREALRPFMTVDDFEFNFGPVAYTDAAGDIAVTRGTWSASVKDNEGNISKISGKNMEVVRRQQDGSWLFIIDHPNGAN